jgi:hypothetical protein
MSTSNQNKVDTQRDLQRLRAAASKISCEVVLTKADGNCLFSALVEQLGRGDNYSADKLRQDIVSFLGENPDSVRNVDFESTEWKTFEGYIESMRRDGTYGDGIAIEAAVSILKRPILILQEDGTVFNLTGPDITDCVEPLRLGYVALQGSKICNHYVGLRKKTLLGCGQHQMSPSMLHETRKTVASEITRKRKPEGGTQTMHTRTIKHWFTNSGQQSAVGGSSQGLKYRVLRHTLCSRKLKACSTISPSVY